MTAPAAATSSNRPPDIDARIREEALFGRLPLLRGEREYSTRGILATGFSYAVAAWCFLIGGYAANYVGAIQGVVALVAGSVAGVTMSSAAAALACNRYGLEQIDYAKTGFGQNGAKLVLVFYVVNQIGWTGMILVMFARGLMNTAKTFGFDGGENLVRIAVLAGLVICYLVVIKGVHVLNVFNSIITPGLVIACIFLFWSIFKDGGYDKVIAAAPIAPTGDGPLDAVIAFEMGLGAGFSWWPGIGFLTRNTDTQRNSLYPQILTMGLGMGVVCCTGLLAGLLFRDGDPTVWLPLVGGRVFGTAALLLLAIANISAGAIMMYTGALGLRHIRALHKVKWRTLALLTFIPMVPFVLAPTTIYEKGSSFLTYNATMFAPIAGILLVDYFLLRKQRVNVSQIFEDSTQGHYRFLGGFNVVAVGCILLGQLLYVWLLNPVSYEPHGPVRLVTASGPAVLIPMLVYWLVSKVWLIPKGIGGYGAPTAAVPVQQPNI